MTLQCKMVGVATWTENISPSSLSNVVGPVGEKLEMTYQGASIKLFGIAEQKCGIWIVCISEHFDLLHCCKTCIVNLFSLKFEHCHAAACASYGSYSPFLVSNKNLYGFAHVGILVAILNGEP